MQPEKLENKPLPYRQISWYIGLHLLFLITAYVCYALLTGRHILPSPKSFCRNDVQFYSEIKNIGYTSVTDAFFPAFPYLWKFTGLGTYGIILLNIMAFYSGFIILIRQFKLNPKEILLFLSLPSLCFIYVPYSEALFFFTSALLLTGLLKRNTAMIMAGLFLCSLCRSAANVFVPAIIITELIATANPHRLKNIILYTFSALTGVFLTAWVQHSQTGDWFGFIKAQKLWNVGLRFPQLPFTTWGVKDHIDGAALLAGLLSSAIMIYYVIRWAIKNEKQDNKAYIFSLLFVAGLTVFTIAFKGGSLYSLNRYTMPTAFFAVVFLLSFRRLLFSFKKSGITAVCIFAFWLIMGSYVHILVLAGYFLFTLYLCLYLFMNNENARIGNTAFCLLYLINIITQVFYFCQFIDGGWVG